MAAALVELSRIQDDVMHNNATWAQLARVKLELEGSMRSIRDISLALRPSMLDELGLVPAPRWQGREIARRSGLVVRVGQTIKASTFQKLTARVSTALFKKPCITSSSTLRQRRLLYSSVQTWMNWLYRSRRTGKVSNPLPR